MPSLVLFLFASCLPSAWLIDQKALDEFVNLPDPHYQYTIEQMKTYGLFRPVTFFNVSLTSQKWLDAMTRNILPFGDSCFLILRPGQTDNLIPFKFYDTLMMMPIAERSKAVVAELMPVLHQPLTFYNHPLGHKNSTRLDIFAYSWWRFLNDSTAPPHLLVEFPMVKAIVRAMDTIVDIVKKEFNKNIKRFTLLGFSTGGWVSWLAAAVDQRIEAIIPVGLDFLNFTESFRYHYRAHCGWSYMLKPFYEMNITQELENPRFSELASHVDPLAYNERYTNVAKYIIVLTGDEITQPDNSRYYFSQLEGTKYFQVIPNANELNDGSKFLDHVLSFYYHLTEGNYTFPISTWEIKRTNTSATIHMIAGHTYRAYTYHGDTVSTKPRRQVSGRDFRSTIAVNNSTKYTPVKWAKYDLHEDILKPKNFEKEMEKAEEGWRGFFIQVLHIQDSYSLHFTVTSEVAVIPDTFPCPDRCRGTLV